MGKFGVHRGFPTIEWTRSGDAWRFRWYGLYLGNRFLGVTLMRRAPEENMPEIGVLQALKEVELGEPIAVGPVVRKNAYGVITGITEPEQPAIARAYGGEYRLQDGVIQHKTTVGWRPSAYDDAVPEDLADYQRNVPEIAGLIRQKFGIAAPEATDVAACACGCGAVYRLYNGEIQAQAEDGSWVKSSLDDLTPFDILLYEANGQKAFAALLRKKLGVPAV